MCDLEVEPSVKESKGLRAHHVDRGTQLAGGE